MSCCPTAPDISTAEVTADEPTAGPEVQRNPGESEDCYTKRKGNVSETGRVDDKIEKVPNKIQQNSIVTDNNAGINLTFTVNGTLRAIDPWEFTPAFFPGTPTPVTMDTQTGVMVGTFTDIGQKLTLSVKANFADGSIDDRTYTFAPSRSDPSSIRLVHPLPGSIVTSGFGPRKPPAQGASSMHMALDFAYPGGITKDVLCACDGEVVLARPGSGYGNYVMVKHLDASGRHLITTLYAHLETIFVKLGQKVSGGQSLGREGNSGISSGAHLHFEVRLPNNSKVDPTPYLQGVVMVANSVNADNTPNTTAGTTPATDTGKALTADQVAARSDC